MKNKQATDSVIKIRPETFRTPSAKILDINEQRILFYAILSIQQNDSTVYFSKTELEEMFNYQIGGYSRIEGMLRNLRTYGFEYVDEKTEKIVLINAFSVLQYDRGIFKFEFTQGFLPILDKQKQFLQFAMNSIQSFKCKYSIYLYDYLKYSMWGKITQRTLTLDEFRNLFKLNDNQYTRNADFARRVWQPALNEINKYTGYYIEIETKGIYKAMTFTINRIKNEDVGKAISLLNNYNFTCQLGKPYIDYACRDCMKINICPLEVKRGSNEEFYNNQDDFICDNMENIFYANPYYDYEIRQARGTLSDLEDDFVSIARTNYYLETNEETEADIKTILNFQREKYKKSIFDEINKLQNKVTEGN